MRILHAKSIFRDKVLPNFAKNIWNYIVKSSYSQHRVSTSYFYSIALNYDSQTLTILQQWSINMIDRLSYQEGWVVPLIDYLWMFHQSLFTFPCNLLLTGASCRKDCWQSRSTTKLLASLPT